MKILNKKYDDLGIYSSDFIKSKPYPHIVLDDFLDKTFFSQLDLENFSIKSKKGLLLIRI